jgi:hypothetical protein
MSEKRESLEDAEGAVLQGPCDTAKAGLSCAMSSINRSAMKLPRVLESLVRTVLSHASNGSQTPKGWW